MTSETSAYGTADAGTWSYTYDPVTLGVTSTSDPNGHVTTSAYDDHGHVVSSSDSRGMTSAYDYADNGALLKQ